jgi:hypothetical protein
MKDVFAGAVAVSKTTEKPKPTAAPGCECTRDGRAIGRTHRSAIDMHGDKAMRKMPRASTKEVLAEDS